ncbi:hypothetical protein BLOT_002164 [Blomia tropicalis]|nr:hypothetical protein BLOT_002164 [Blomia tropicalis]
MKSPRSNFKGKLYECKFVDLLKPFLSQKRSPNFYFETFQNILQMRGLHFMMCGLHYRIVVNLWWENFNKDFGKN